MKKSNIYKLLLSALSLCLTLMMATSASAHYPWINLSDYTPDKGAVIQMTIGWGHRYPLAGFMEKSAVEAMKVSGPEAVELEYVSDLEVRSGSIGKPGTYIIGATRRPGFYTKTAQGGKRTSKEGLENVIRCSFSHMCMKAVVNAGSGTGKADTVMGHPMEIIPLKNPGELRQGDYLPVRVLYKGKPYKGNLFATYAGFSTEKSTFAYATATDKKGRASIRMLTPGVWLIKAGHEQPYPDKDVCDVASYVATLTFEIK
ncbi:MAG: DUF4198 domain-containing protein [Desulfobacterales bacterium]|nr:DUF4198 domain-containing protein [Desulfobacterales bacterium]